MEIKKAQNTFTQYEAEYDGHQLHILIEEDKENDLFNYYLRVDNQGDFEFMYGSPKHNTSFGEDITYTEESFLDLMLNGIEDDIETYFDEVEIYATGFEQIHGYR